MNKGDKPVHRECAKSGAFSQDVVRLLESAMVAAGSERVSRKLIAIKLGVQPERLNKWIAPSHPNAIPSGTLLQLMVSDIVLPDGARRKFFGEIATMAGFVVCDDTDEDAKSFPAQITEISAAFGLVSGRVLEAMNPKSDAGGKLSATEKNDLVHAIDRAMDELQQLKSAVVKGGRR